MTDARMEAAPVARLIGEDGECTVGLVYRWNTSELSILWIEEDHPARYIDPPLHPDTLAKAKVASAASVPAILVELTDGTPPKEP